jgi:hypothetical protein
MLGGPGLRRSAALAVILLTGLATVQPSNAADQAPPTGKIKAVLQPPHTFYTADVTDPDGNALSFDWSLTTIGCGSWQAAVSAGPDTADWYHGGGVGDLTNKSNPPVECDHGTGTNSGNHPGTFWVKVSDGTGNTVACKFAGPGGPPGSTQVGPPCESLQYDLSVSGQGPPVVDVGFRAEFTFTITNKGPHPAAASLTVLHVGSQEINGEEVSVFNPATAAAIGYQTVVLQPGASIEQKSGLRFTRPGTYDVPGRVTPDQPPGPPNNPSDNEDSVTVSVNKAACTRKAGRLLLSPDDANVKDKQGRQVVCTKGGDDRITAGDQDVVYSKGGDDVVTCKEPFCVLELGGGNDTAKCPQGCFVNGGPGKDNCPEGDLVIKDGCEK